MEIIQKDIDLYSPSAECQFKFKMGSQMHQMITCEATSLKRFSVLIAAIDNNQWRLRCRIVVTKDKGLLCFPLRKTVPEINEKYYVRRVRI